MVCYTIHTYRQTGMRYCPHLDCGIFSILIMIPVCSVVSSFDVTDLSYIGIFCSYSLSMSQSYCALTPRFDTVERCESFRNIWYSSFTCISALLYFTLSWELLALFSENFISLMLRNLLIAVVNLFIPLRHCAVQLAQKIFIIMRMFVRFLLKYQTQRC